MPLPPHSYLLNSYALTGLIGNLRNDNANLCKHAFFLIGSVIEPNFLYSFAQHLTSILSHSLSLCAAGGQEFQYDPELSSPETSPRSSISTSSAEADLASSNTSQLYRQRLSSLPSVSSKRRLELIDCLGQWAFDANELNQDELCECACIIFECVLTMDGLDSSLDIRECWCYSF